MVYEIRLNQELSLTEVGHVEPGYYLGDTYEVPTSISKASFHAKIPRVIVKRKHGRSSGSTLQWNKVIESVIVVGLRIHTCINDNVKF